MVIILDEKLKKQIRREVREEMKVYWKKFWESEENFEVLFSKEKISTAQDKLEEVKNGN